MWPSEDGPIFHKVNNILIETWTQFYFITEKLLDEHTGHYQFSKKINSWEILDINKIFSYKITNETQASNGETFIVQK